MCRSVKLEPRRVMTMIQYPLKFRFTAQGTSGIQQVWSTNTQDASSMTCAIPPEFDGPGGGYSPEDFFGLAVMNCFVATFKVIAERSKLSFLEVKAQAELIVDRDAQGAPWMSAMNVQINLRLQPGQEHSRARHLLEKTAASCLVARSIKTDVRFFFELE